MTPAWLRDLDGADPYALLGVPRDATTAAVVRAHRARIREFHPDRATGDARQARLVNLAREILLDPTRRAELDRLTSQAGQAGSRPAWDADDLVAAAGPPPAPQPSEWEAEDVAAGTDTPSYSSFSPEPAQWSYQPDYQQSRYDTNEDYYDYDYDWRQHEPAYHDQPVDHDQHSFYHQQYQAYPVAPPPSLAKPVIALVSSFICTPVGLVLGILAWQEHRYWRGTGLTLAIVAIVVNAALLLLTFGLCCGGSLLSSLTAPPG